MISFIIVVLLTRDLFCLRILFHSKTYVFFGTGPVGDLGGAVGPGDWLCGAWGGTRDQWGTLGHAFGRRTTPGGHTGRLLDIHTLSISPKTIENH